MTHPTLGGTGAVTGTVREATGRRCGRDPYREAFGAGGRSSLDVPVAERTLDPDLDVDGGVLDR